jgi:hypothetical protein
MHGQGGKCAVSPYKSAPYSVFLSLSLFTLENITTLSCFTSAFTSACGSNDMSTEKKRERGKKEKKTSTQGGREKKKKKNPGGKRE